MTWLPASLFGAALSHVLIVWFFFLQVSSGAATHVALWLGSVCLFFLLEKVMFSSEDPDVILVRFWCYSNDSLIRFFSPLFQDQFYSWKTGRFPSWDSDIILERLPGFFQDQYDIFFFRWGWNFSLFWMKPILIRGRQLFDHFYSFFFGRNLSPTCFYFF